MCAEAIKYLVREHSAYGRKCIEEISSKGQLNYELDQ